MEYKIISEYTLKTFLIFFYKNKILFFLYFLFLIFTYPLQAIIIPRIFTEFFKNIDNNKNYKKYFIYIIIAFSIINISYCIVDYIEVHITPNFIEYYINYIFKNILKLCEKEYLDLELGKTNYIFTVIPNSLRELLILVCNSIFPQLFSIFLLIIYFFYMNFSYGSIVLCSFIIYIVVLYYLFIDCQKKSKLRYKIFLEKVLYTNDKFSNLFSIYSSGKTNNEIDEYTEKSKIFKKSYKNNLNSIFKIKIFNNMYNNILCIIFILFIISLYINKNIDKNTLIILLITLLYYFPCFNIIINSL